MKTIGFQSNIRRPWNSDIRIKQETVLPKDNVLINRKVQSLLADNGSSVIGKGLLNCFSGDVDTLLTTALQTNTSQRMKKCRFSGATYDIDCIPLMGRFKRKGAILTLKPPGKRA